jgi:hypothetical protein
MKIINCFFNRNSRLLISGILISLFISCGVQQKYVKEARKWEPDMHQFDSLNRAQQYARDAILFTGSSSIKLWSTIREDMAPYPVIQRGFGGSKFSDLAVYIKRIVYPHDFSALVIFEANDITGSASDKTPKEVENLFRHIVKVVRRKVADKPIYVIEITPTESRWKTWPVIKEANARLEKASGELHNVHFIHTASYYLNEKGEPRAELFRADKLHMNRKGYEIWGRVIREAIK